MDRAFSALAMHVGLLGQGDWRVLRWNNAPQALRKPRLAA